MKRAPALALAVLAGLPLLSGCSRSAVRSGEARVEPHGVVQVAPPNKPYEPIRANRTIHDGYRVRVTVGTALVRLPHGELDLRDGSEVRVGPAPELLAGDLLVVPDRALAVTSAGTQAVSHGPSRVSRDFAVTVASYAGGVDLSSAGATLHLPALRQAAIPALGQLPVSPTPLQYRATDPWDRRFLADAIDLGVELDARSQGASALFKSEGKTAGFYRTLFPALDQQPEFGQALLDPNRLTGEHIVGVGVALAGKRGDFAQRWKAIFDFRGQGAAWGLVAADQDVVSVPGLVKSIDDALSQTELPAQIGTLALSVPKNVPAPKATTTTTTRTSGSTTTAPPTSQPPTTTTTLVPNPPGTGVGVIDQTGENTVDTLNGLLNTPP
jgi:hypothetical protein